MVSQKVAIIANAINTMQRIAKVANAILRGRRYKKGAARIRASIAALRPMGECQKENGRDGRQKRHSAPQSARKGTSGKSIQHGSNGARIACV